MAELMLRSPSDYLVLDGGLATYLETQFGVNLKNTNLWSARILATNPELIERVHYDYAVAGAQIITTATYQASYDHYYKELGLTADEVDEVLRKSLSLAQKAVQKYVEDYKPDRKPLIAASMGPYGASLPGGAEFHGKYVETVPKDSLKEYHRRRLRVLATCNNPKPDLLAFETFPSVVEAVAVAELLDEENITIPTWISFSCNSSETTCHGEHITDAVRQLEPFSRVSFVGVNCTDPKHIESLIKLIRTVTSKPIIVYPNSGEIWDHELREFIAGTGATHSELGLLAKAWYAAGARVIGGCCRTQPKDIVEIRKALESVVK